MMLRPSLATLALCAALSACSGLPQDVQRPVSHALETPAETALGQQVAQRRVAANATSASGFLLLSGPDDAYGSRLALTEAAQKTLDLQYYAIHADASTARLLRSVVAAARRGVRVRVLLDDFHSTGRDAQVMRLAFEPNIEMRMFNPVAGPRASKIGRIFSAVMDFSRAQQRMHNKLFLADNAMGVTGGRNLGDAYFGNAEAGNFVDLDVLAAGPIVAELSRSFDSYWNNERAYPVQSLVSEEDLLKMRKAFSAEDAAAARTLAESESPDLPAPVPTPPAAQKAQNAQNAAGAASEPPAEPGAKGTPTAAQRARAADFKAMDLARARFVWAPAVMLADKPAKISAESKLAAPRESSDGPARKARTPGTAQAATSDGAPAGRSQRETAAAVQSGGPVGKAKPRDPQPEAPATGPAADTDAASAEEAQGDTVVDGLLQLMDHAKTDLLIVSPYFVPGKSILQAFADARARGVRVRVLTNSLASNDAPIAHAGYMGHRPALLGMGVELYEMRSELAGLRGAMGLSGSGGGVTGSSRAMLHSKLMVVDGHLLAIGSMNLDLRSELQNTEIALLIRSSKLSSLAATQIEIGLRELAWHVEKDGGGLVWRAPEGSGLEDTRQEPDTSTMLRLLMRVLGPLAPDHLL